MWNPLVCLQAVLIIALVVGANPAAAQQTSRDSFGGANAPVNRLQQADVDQKGALFPVPSLEQRRQQGLQRKETIYEATGLKYGAFFAHAFQGASRALPNEDEFGTATTFTGIAAWELLHRGQPTRGRAIVQVESRWDYGGIGAEDVGFISLASAIGTADTYAAYPQAFVLRNLFWRQGSPEAAWVYRIGKISPDALFAASEYLDSQTTFLPTGGVTSSAVAFPDSGFGAAGGVYLFDNRVALGGGISDANGDRFNFGDLGAGDFFKVIELQAKIAPTTADAPYSKLTFWHTDGTKNGMPLGAQLGPSGWGFFVLHQQELTPDGRAVGILRYGKSYSGSAFYEQQAGASFVLKEPGFVRRLKNDMVGIAFNWARPGISPSRDEYNLETFYRFPLLPGLDTTLSYQSVFDPAFTRDLDHASVFTLRLRTAL